MRTVTINLPEDFILNKAAIFALGRSAAWALQEFPICNIYHDGKRDMVAVYQRTAEQNGPSYVIGAVYREESDEYSFHS